MKMDELETLLDRRCPICGRRFSDVALAKDYVVIGCTEHRDFDVAVWFDELEEE